MECVKSEILIKEADFKTCETLLKNSVTTAQLAWLDMRFGLYKQGNLRYISLYRSMERAVKGGYSTYESMEDLAMDIERDCWYLHNYGDANWWKHEKENKNNEIKIYNTLSGRQ